MGKLSPEERGNLSKVEIEPRPLTRVGQPLYASLLDPLCGGAATGEGEALHHLNLSSSLTGDHRQPECQYPNRSVEPLWLSHASPGVPSPSCPGLMASSLGHYGRRGIKSLVLFASCWDLGSSPEQDLPRTYPPLPPGWGLGGTFLGRMLQDM